MQRPPELERPFLTFAADDGGQKGQAVRYGLSSDGAELAVRLYLPEDATCKAWSWCSLTLTLPEVVRKELARGGTLLAPDLRQARAGSWVLDVKVEALPKGSTRGSAGRVLTFDWGLRKLISAFAMQGAQGPQDGLPVETQKGRQLSRPFFLQVGGVYGKLKELRAHADLLRKKADRLQNLRLLTPGLSQGEGERLAAEEAGARAELGSVWRRYSELQEALAHLGANFSCAWPRTPAAGSSSASGSAA